MLLVFFLQVSSPNPPQPCRGPTGFFKNPLWAPGDLGEDPLEKNPNNLYTFTHFIFLLWFSNKNSTSKSVIIRRAGIGEDVKAVLVFPIQDKTQISCFIYRASVHIKILLYEISPKTSRKV